MATTAAPPEATPAPTSSTARWRVLLGAIVVQLILGTVYGYSIFWAPLEAEVFPRFISESERTTMAAGRSDVSGLLVLADQVAKTRHDQQQGLLKYAFALCILTFALTMVAAGRVQDRKGPRSTALMGAGLLGLGFLLGGLALRQPEAFGSPTALVVVLWLTVGLIAGAGIGFAYVCPIAALIKWFPKAKGLVSGIAVAGFGFGAYIFSNKDLPFGGPGFISEYGISNFFIVHGLVAFLAVAAGAMMLSNPPDTATAGAAPGTDWRGTLKAPAFYIIWLMFFSGALAGLMVIGIVKDFAGAQLAAAASAQPGTDAYKQWMEQGAAAVGWLAIFNAIGRVLWGIISDKAGRTGAFVAMFAFQAVMMFVLSGMRTEVTLAVAACIVGFNFGGNFALFPSATADMFGARNLGANYGLVFTSYGVAGVVGIYAGNYAKVATGSYTAAFMVAGAMCVLSAVLAVVLHAMRKRALAAAA